MGLRHVIFHSPGAQWKSGSNFQEQDEEIVLEHIQHFAKLKEEGKLYFGGPFVDIDSGGMMITVEDVSREEIEQFSAADPAVAAGLLNFDVKSWYVAMEI